MSEQCENANEVGAVGSDAIRAEQKKRKGWVRLYRSLLDGPKPIVADAVLFQLLGYVLLRAGHKPRTVKVSIGHAFKTVDLLPGQLIFGVPKASKFLRQSPSTIRDKISRLRSLGVIVTESVTHYSIVTVCNWGTYQGKEKRSRAPSRASVRAGDRDAVRAEVRVGVRHKQECSNKNASNKNSSRRALRFDDADRELAERMLRAIVVVAPGFKQPDLDRWANEIRLAREQDGRTHADLGERFDQAHADPFWRSNILSPSALRKQYDRLTAKFKGSTAHGNQQQTSPARIRTSAPRKPLTILSNAPASA